MSKLQEEIRMGKKFDSAKIEAFLALQRTTDLASRPVERVFSRWRLTPEQYNVLRILRGSDPEGLPTLEIGRRMITRASNVTRIIDRLEIKGLAIRKREKHDRRVVRIRISPKGNSLLDEMNPMVFQTTEEALEGLSNQEAERLSSLLEKIRIGLEKRAARPPKKRRPGRQPM